MVAVIIVTVLTYAVVTAWAPGTPTTGTAGSRACHPASTTAVTGSGSVCPSRVLAGWLHRCGAFHRTLVRSGLERAAGPRLQWG